MRVLRRVAALRRLLARERRQGRKVALVPTMGALHEGHGSLVDRARRSCDVVVVSIFVNPLQFGPREDFKRYPRPFSRDAGFCRARGVDVLFAPSARELYPPGFQTFVDQRDLPRFLCGPRRPGHFRGVMTVVAKLFGIVQPDVAFFGQKDFQQAAVIRQMARDLDLPVRVAVCPTVREPGGLAMSSRNAYLSRHERAKALALVHALKSGRRMIREGERRGDRVARAMRSLILREAPGCRIDYASVADPETLEPVRRIKGRVLLALAVRIGKTRLVDNSLA